FLRAVALDAGGAKDWPYVALEIDSDGGCWESLRTKWCGMRSAGGRHLDRCCQQGSDRDPCKSNLGLCPSLMKRRKGRGFHEFGFLAWLALNTETYASRLFDSRGIQEQWPVMPRALNTTCNWFNASKVFGKYNSADQQPVMINGQWVAYVFYPEGTLGTHNSSLCQRLPTVADNS